MSRDRMRYWGPGLAAIPNLNINGFTSFAPANIQGIPYTINKPSSGITRLLSALATTNLLQLVAGPAVLRRVQGYNNKASAVFLKVYDSPTPVVGTTVPVYTKRIAATADFDIEVGAYASTGLAIAITGAAADNDTTALVAGDIVAANFFYDLA